MKINILGVHESCVDIACSANSILELYDELCGLGGNPHLEYVVKALVDRIKAANKIVEMELEPLMADMNVDHPTVEITIVTENNIMSETLM